MFNRKGFTLIELLVVIAVLGILASVVLVAINPSERINEAEDSGIKNDVGQVATAMEAFFTNQRGTYSGMTMSQLISLGYLKRDPGTVDISVSAGNTSAVAYGTLDAQSAGTCANTNYWTFYSETGSSYICCLASAPTATAFDTAVPATCAAQ